MSTTKKTLFLSYILDKDSPSYGNRDKLILHKKSSIENGDAANNTFFSSTTHIGTHMDMPYHFHENGQTIEDYPPDFWFFSSPQFIEINPQNKVVCDELIEKIDILENKNCDILIVKTGSCYHRNKLSYATENIGFHPKLHLNILNKFPNIKVFGFDSISISSFTDRMLGREAHRSFLNPERPIILLEDMDLSNISETTNIKEIIIAPLQIRKSDGIPCTVYAKI